MLIGQEGWLAPAFHAAPLQHVAVSLELTRGTCIDIL